MMTAFVVADVVRAFILYRQAQHAKVVSQNPQMPNPEISKVIGEQWQGLSSEEKDEWKAFAEVCTMTIKSNKVRCSDQAIARESSPCTTIP